MKRTTGKVFALTALSSLLLLASACGQSSGQSPSGSATRAQAAVILTRFCQTLTNP